MHWYSARKGNKKKKIGTIRQTWITQIFKTMSAIRPHPPICTIQSRDSGLWIWRTLSLKSNNFHSAFLIFPFLLLFFFLAVQNRVAVLSRLHYISLLVNDNVQQSSMGATHSTSDCSIFGVAQRNLGLKWSTDWKMWIQISLLLSKHLQLNVSYLYRKLW